MKQVKFLPYKQKFYFTIIDYVNQHNKLPSLPISKQARNHYIKKLKIDGILIKRGYGTWGVDEDKINQFNFIEKVKKTPKAGSQHLTQNFTSLKDKRGHGFIISFIIPNIPGWHKREQYLEKNNISFKNVGLNNSGQRIIVKGHKVHLYKSKVLIYSPSHLSYFSSTAEESYKYALYDLQQVLKQVENILGVSFLINKTYKFKISRQHYGKINDNIAKMYKRDGKRLYIANENGVWLITDNSLNMNELETVNKNTAVSDMDKVLIPFLNSLKKQYEVTGEPFQIDKLMQMQYTNFKTQQQISRNIEDLTNLIKQIILKGEQE